MEWKTDSNVNFEKKKNDWLGKWHTPDGSYDNFLEKLATFIFGVFGKSIQWMR